VNSTPGLAAEPVGNLDVVAVRRDLHQHPELAFRERRTTDVIVDWLESFGLRPTVLPKGTGVLCDLGREDGPLVGLRADIDALPIADDKSVPYRSTVDGACHGCGHDAHTAILLGAAEVLAEEQDQLAGRVRLVFQPGEETVPGGALRVIEAGGLEGVAKIFALHCDPRIETGRIGLRIGAITAATDHVEVMITGPGGHTARPHLTADVVYALGRLITDVPGLLSRRVDPRAGLSLVWGAVQAGRAANAIPMTGRLRGTLRVLDREVWGAAEPLLRTLVQEVADPCGVDVATTYTRGVPPVVNTRPAVELQRHAVVDALGETAVTDTPQSMGGEDFAWYLESVPGALARLGVRRPGARPFDLHQGTFDIDEGALEVGVRYTAELARRALMTLAEPKRPRR
jgi:amidohydrolase